MSNFRETLKLAKRGPTSKITMSKNNKAQKESTLQLMRRRALAKAAEKDPRVQKLIDKEKEKEKKEQTRIAETDKKYNDPVSWFGCLIPPEVRQGKEAFSAGLENLVRVAEIRRQMRRIEEEIHKLKKKLRQAT